MCQRLTCSVNRFLFTSAITCLFVSCVMGGFTRIEDFEALTLAPISGQGGWSGGTSNLVALDPADAANQVLEVNSLSTLLRKPLLLEQGTQRMLFLRFRIPDQLTASFGLSFASFPTEFSDFGPELSLTNAQPELRIANSLTTGVYDELTPLANNVWYNVWLLVDHVNQTTQVWLHNHLGEFATSANQQQNADLEDLFGYRTPTSNNLVNFYIKTGSGGSGEFGPLWIDDLYLEDSSRLNLSNPTNPLPGDFNRDGMVDTEDLARWQSAYGLNDLADADHDGDTDGSDFEIWQQNLGNSIFPAANVNAIPEPLSLLLALCLIFCLPLARDR